MEKHIASVSDSFPLKKEIYVMGLLKALRVWMYKYE